MNRKNNTVATTIDPESDRTSWVILVILSVVWGCSFILIKKALAADFTTYQLASMRIAIAATAFTPFVIAQRKNINWSKWYIFLAVGLTGTGLPAFLFFAAQTKVSSSVAGLLNSLTPIWTLIFGVVLFNLKFTRNILLGLIVGFLGAGMLVLFGPARHVDGGGFYSLLILLASVCYAVSTNLVQSFFSDVKPIIISSLSFGMLGIPTIAYLLYSDVQSVFVNDPRAWTAFGYVALLSLVGTFLASILFYYLIQRTNALFASTVTYLMPIVALFWGIVDNEPVGFLHFMGLSMILVGVFITKKK